MLGSQSPLWPPHLSCALDLARLTRLPLLRCPVSVTPVQCVQLLCHAQTHFLCPDVNCHDTLPTCGAQPAPVMLLPSALS